MYQSIGRNEAYLRLLANQLLTKEESEVFKEALYNFRVSKSIPKLCSQLRPIISTVEKMILLVEISNRLPTHLRQDFHRLCSLHFDKYNDVLKTMTPGKQFQEKAKVIAQDSTGGIRVLAKGNQKTLVFTSQADQEALRRNAASASESSLTMDQPVSDKSSLFQSDESLRMFRRSLSSDNSEDTLFATRNQTNNAIFNGDRSYGENKMAIYSQPMQLGSSLDSSTASESFETFRNKYDKSHVFPAHSNVQHNNVPINHISAVQFRPAVRHVTLSRSGLDSLGISIRGGQEHETPVTVQNVEAGSQAEKKGLTQGDILLEVNGYNFQNISHSRAVEIIKSQHNLHLTVTKARPQHLPDNMPKGLGDPIPVHRLVEKDVTLTATKEGGLGFSLSGGADQTAAPIIADVFKNSPAETAGLLRDDRVLKILGIDVKELTHKQIVALATSSKVLKLRIQRRIQEEARNVHHSGTIYSGNHIVSTPANGILSLPNGDGPQFASSPVIRRKSHSSLSIDGEDKENNRGPNGAVAASIKTRNFFNISNGPNGNHTHDAHNLKVHAAQVSSHFEETDFQTEANNRRKYVKRREQASPTVHKDSVYSTYSYRHGAPPIDASGFFGNAGNTATMERRSHHSSASEISKSPHSTMQKNRRPFSSFIVVPTPKVSSKDVNMKAALKEGLEKRNKALQNLRNVHPSARDEEWKI
ncbi:uncharacterized protein LOC135470463 isoform X2 [Liolophura sinensis]